MKFRLTKNTGPIITTINTTPTMNVKVLWSTRAQCPVWKHNSYGLRCVFPDAYFDAAYKCPIEGKMQTAEVWNIPEFRDMDTKASFLGLKVAISVDDDCGYDLVLPLELLSKRQIEVDEVLAMFKVLGSPTVLCGNIITGSHFIKTIELDNNVIFDIWLEARTQSAC